MTENLRLVGPRVLSSSDTNIALSSMTLPASTSGWCTDNESASCVQDLSHGVHDSGRGDYGVYYSWYWATATYGTYGSIEGEIDYSICPSNWQLPSVSMNSGLIIKYGESATAYQELPMSFVLSGGYWGSSYIEYGVSTSLWTKNSISQGYSYYFAIYPPSDAVIPGFSGLYGKPLGTPIRCVAQ